MTRRPVSYIFEVFDLEFLPYDFSWASCFLTSSASL